MQKRSPVRHVRSCDEMLYTGEKKKKAVTTEVHLLQCLGGTTLEETYTYSSRRNRSGKRCIPYTRPNEQTHRLYTVGIS